MTLFFFFVSIFNGMHYYTVYYQLHIKGRNWSKQQQQLCGYFIFKYMTLDISARESVRVYERVEKKVLLGAVSGMSGYWKSTLLCCFSYTHIGYFSVNISLSLLIHSHIFILHLHWWIFSMSRQEEYFRSFLFIYLLSSSLLSLYIYIYLSHSVYLPTSIYIKQQANTHKHTKPLFILFSLFNFFYILKNTHTHNNNNCRKLWRFLAHIYTI